MIRPTTIATIIALIVTIIYTNDSQRNQNILSVKPYLQSEYVPIFNYSEITNHPSKLLYIVFNSNISSSFVEPYMLGRMKEDNFNKRAFLNKFYIMKYTLKNVGADSATNIKWTLNDKPIIPEFAISKDETTEYIIVVDSSFLEDNKIILNLKYEYEDVFGLASYYQTETIQVLKDKISLTSIQDKDDVITPPKMI